MSAPIPTFEPGAAVYAGNTLASFVRIVPVSGLAIIRVGLDTRVVDPVTLRSAK